MKDTQLHERMLGIERPWEVESLTLEDPTRSVVVKVRCRKTTWVCPDARQRVHVHGYETRRWRHLDSCQYKTIIEAEVPCLKYPDGRTQMLAVPWAEGSSRFTALFERLVIDLLLCCSVADVSRILRVGWDAADAVRRICVDEKSYRRGHEYVTCVASVGEDGKARIVHVADECRQESLAGFFKRFSSEQLGRIEAACIDMWQPYLKALEEHLPDGQSKVSHDPFYLMQHMNKAVNETRKKEHSKLRKEGDDRLKGTRQLWLLAEENLTEDMLERFDAMKDLSLKTGRAWSIKEVFREFLKCADRQEAADCFKLWHQWACRCRLPAVEKVVRMFKRHLVSNPQLLRPQADQRPDRRPQQQDPVANKEGIRLQKPRTIQNRHPIPSRRPRSLSRLNIPTENPEEPIFFIRYE